MFRASRRALAIFNKAPAFGHHVPTVGGCLGAVLLLLLGCSASQVRDNSTPDMAHYQVVATQIEYPAAPTPCDETLLHTPPPRKIRDPSHPEWDLSHAGFRNMTLQEVMQTALINSRVLLDLGGTVLRTPDTVQTTYGIAAQETDPQYGPEAALGALTRNSPPASTPRRVTSSTTTWRWAPTACSSTTMTSGTPASANAA